tara:strand:+ start:711 stop:1010 length:300 start_codon:yes stop_codon:yes gene_type:complete
MILSWEDILKVRVPVGRAQGSDERLDIFMDVSKRILAGAMILDAFEDAGKSVTVGKELLIKNLDYTPQEMNTVEKLYDDMAGGKWGDTLLNERFEQENL